MPKVHDTVRASRHAWNAAVLNLILQCVIVLTGGLVRLTGSGLGCSTWPACTPGNVTTTPEQGIHGAIEFGNRLLSFPVLAVAVAVLITAWRTHRPIRWWAAIPTIGVLIQAVVGGVTVLTKLSPLWVGTHLLVSIAIIAVSSAYLVRLRQPDGPTSLAVAKPVSFMAWAQLLLLAVVLVIGTLVTGSGIHSGDFDEAARLGFNFEEISKLHVDVVMVFMGLTIGLLAVTYSTDTPRNVRTMAQITLGIALAQGAVGYWQYFTGVPIALVAIHLVGACILTAAVAALVASCYQRSEPRSGERLDSDS